MSALIHQNSPQFRAMRSEDVGVVANIERSTYDFPWSPGIFADCLRVGYDCKVLECDGEVVGFGIMSTAAGECHILNVCLAAEFQGQGLGRTLVYHMIDIAEASRAQRVYLEVRPSNRAALRLYESIGFIQIGLRKGYYRARPPEGDLFGREDAMVMALALDAPRPRF
ncbi:MAG: ribosomal protein S18-alanine N-acetyltransferase [Pseudomonadota bacterium]